MRPLVLTPKFKRAFRKFVKRNADLQERIEDTLQQMETNRILKGIKRNPLTLRYVIILNQDYI